MKYFILAAVVAIYSITASEAAPDNQKKSIGALAEGGREEALLLINSLDKNKSMLVLGGSEQYIEQLERLCQYTDALSFMLKLPQPQLPLRNRALIYHSPVEMLQERVIDEFLERCRRKVAMLSSRGKIFLLQEVAKEEKLETALVDFLARSDDIHAFSNLLTLAECETFSEATREKAIKVLAKMKTNKEVLAMMWKATENGDTGRLAYLFSVREPPPQSRDKAGTEEFLEKCLAKMIRIAALADSMPDSSPAN